MMTTAILPPIGKAKKRTRNLTVKPASDKPTQEVYETAAIEILSARGRVTETIGITDEGAMLFEKVAHRRPWARLVRCQSDQLGGGGGKSLWRDGGKPLLTHRARERVPESNG